MNETKAVALVAAALATQGTGATPAELRSYADDLVWWLEMPRPVAWMATFTVTDRGGRVLVASTSEGALVADNASLPVDQFGAVTLHEADSHGNPLPDTASTITWSEDSAGSLVNLRVSADTHTVAVDPVGPEGTVNITGNDQAAPGLAPYVLTLALGPGSPAALAGAFRTSATPIDPDSPAGP